VESANAKHLDSLVLFAAMPSGASCWQREADSWHRSSVVLNHQSISCSSRSWQHVDCMV